MVMSTRYDTSRFEVLPEFDAQRVLNEASVGRVRAMLDLHGFVVLPGFLTSDEVAAGKELMTRTIAGSEGEKANFASETDISYRRRDFHAVPWDEPARSYVAMILRRTGTLLEPYCDSDAAVLEFSTMVSHPGSSHQYLHRDPEGAISGFLALEDVDQAMGGTVYVPGTHAIDSSLLTTYRTLLNLRVMARNLAKVARMQLGRDVRPEPGEVRARVFSSMPDNHQPNIRGFLSGSNEYLSRRNLSPGELRQLVTQGRRACREFELVGTTPARATLLLYHSNIVHAGPDNHSSSPRSLMSFSVSRSAFDPVGWRGGYAPHSTMLGRPTMVAELAGWPDP